MRKIKIFSDCEPGLVEARMNTWLCEHQTAIIFRVLQSESYTSNMIWSLTITIFYYEGEPAQ